MSVRDLLTSDKSAEGILKLYHQNDNHKENCIVLVPACF